MRSLTFSFFPAPGLRMPARKANDFGFRTQTPSHVIQKRRPGGRPGSRTPARKAYDFRFRARTPARKKWEK